MNGAPTATATVTSIISATDSDTMHTGMSTYPTAGDEQRPSTPQGSDIDNQEGKKVLTSENYYYDSYAHFGIHEEMLKDKVRTGGYQKAIMQNKHLFKDKIVLDVGCGTGILCMFAATAGAKMVIGVDMSDIIDQARLIIQENDMQDRITLLKGKMEEVVLPVDKVDIIISEWMGYFLLYESMLDTVLVARDRYLKEGGLLFPDRAVLYLAAIEDADYRNDKFSFWDDVYGYSFKTLRDIAMREPVVDCVDSSAVVTHHYPIATLDLYKIRSEELDFTTRFRLRATRNDYVHAFVSFFVCSFNECHGQPVQIQTSPFHKPTHWKQTVFYFRETLPMKSGENIEGLINVERNKKNSRDLVIKIEYAFDGEYGSAEEQLHYKMY